MNAPNEPKENPSAAGRILQPRGDLVPAFKPIPIHYTAELAWAVETDAYPKTDIHVMQFRGPLDQQAFLQAFDEIIPTYRVAHCHLIERRVGITRRLFWTPCGKQNTLIVKDCRGRTALPVDGPTFIMDHFREATHRRINIFEDFPFRIHLLRVADDLHFFATVYHHISVDAAVAYVFMKDIFARYHELTTGRRPPWADVASINTARNPDVPVKPQPWSAFLWENARSLIRYRASTVSMIASGPVRDLLGRNLNRALFDEDTVRGIRALLKKHGASLVDVLLAVIFQQIGSWDREHKLPQNVIRCLLGVNIRSRVPSAKNQSVALSGLHMIYERPEQIPFEELVGQIRDERIRQLEEGVDAAMFRGLATFTRVFSFLPVAWRSWLARKLLSAPVTFILSNIGIMWPEIKNAQLTGRSSFTRFGDVEIDDVFACPSFTMDVGMGVVTRTLGRRLFINYSTDRRRFSGEEAEALTSRISDAIRALDRYA